MKYLYKNNELIRENQLQISIDDRSFRFGDGCFESIPFQNRKCLHLDEHLSRLQSTLKSIKINLDISKISQQIRKLFNKNELDSGLIRIICTRGNSSKGYLPNNSKAYYLVVMNSHEFIKSQPIDLFISSYRHYSNEQLPTTGKINSALLYVLARIEAEENNCDEALILNNDEHICEGSSSNIFFLRNSILHFPSNYSFFIQGITESIVKEISPYKIKSGLYSISDVETSESVYISNSIKGIVQVKTIKNSGINFKINTADPIITEYEKYINNYYGL